MQDVVIIGGGLSGTLLAVQVVLQNGPGPLRVCIVDPSDRFHTGVAYRTQDDTHLLNVPAGKMSLFPDQPEHFLIWLRANGFAYGEENFVPRPVYARYIRYTFNQVQGQFPGHIQLAKDRVADLRESLSGVLIRLEKGQRIRSRQVVLALGNFPPSALSPLQAAGDPRYVRDPWQGDPWHGMDRYNSVLLVGTGLTMVDMVRSLHRRQHQGAITAVSTHGELPAGHCPYPGEYPSFGQAVPETGAEAVGLLKHHLKRAKTVGVGWQAVLDALRPDTAVWWQALSPVEQLRLIRHAGHRWNVTRHRMPPESEQIIRELISRGQLRLVAGRISQACSHPAGIRCTVANRKGTELETIHAQRVINCTGPESDPLRWKSPLVQGLLSRGTMRLHPNGLGLDATPAGALIDAQGKVSDRLYAIGPLLRAVLFESVAVPEIRLQAQTLAKMLLTQKALQAGSSPGVRDKSRPAP